MQNKKWSSVSVPSVLIEDIKRVTPWLGYTSIGEYVRTVLRRQVQRDLITVEDKEAHANLEETERL